MLAILVISVLFQTNQISGSMWFFTILGLSLFYGILFVLPIGGADMFGCDFFAQLIYRSCSSVWRFLYNNYVMLIGES